MAFEEKTKCNNKDMKNIKIIVFKGIYFSLMMPLILVAAATFSHSGVLHKTWFKVICALFVVEGIVAIIIGLIGYLKRVNRKEND